MSQREKCKSRRMNHANLPLVVAMGFGPLDWFRNEGGLDPLRARGDFQELMDLALPDEPFAPGIASGRAARWPGRSLVAKLYGREKETPMAETFLGEVHNGVIVLDPVPGQPLPPEGTRVRVEIAGRSSGLGQSDPLAATRAWLIDAAKEAEADASSLPADLARNHDHYAQGRPRS